MPITSFSPREVTLATGTQASVTVTTTPTDINLMSCSLTMSGNWLNNFRVLAAFVEIRARVRCTGGASGFSTSQELDICPDGTNYYSAISLTNLCTTAAALTGGSQTQIRGVTDVSTYVNSAIANAHDITFRIPQATSSANTFILEDVLVILHLYVI